MSTLPPPAAWYPDPQNPNHLRWWDGVQWTAATAPVAASTAAAATPAVRAKTHTGWRTVAIIVASLVIGGILARLSPVAIVLAALAVIVVGLVVLIARPLPGVGLRTRRSGLAALGVAALLITGGGVASASPSPSTEAGNFATPNSIADIPPTASASRPTPTPVPTTVGTLTENVAIPFERTTIDDPLRDQGTTAVVTAGVDGVKVITYRVTMVDGVEVAREVVSETVQTAPVAEVTAIGSKAPAPPPAPVPLVQQGGGGCDSNYTGACVPIASDVDCAGGSGNGPAYVQGPVRIVGSDIYDLDRDGDGIACD
ncbi:G5 domain-containing protein [Microbacterium hydrocarbonoxydans]|uniref:G5 domain-containing protein n=1 Tax=Microbacterium hydrocarbonoxydans TaxID=273678 RepID=UPI0013D9B50E|nr:G5 domain-containing protein [Microbacterium hydrocarbonoxydans]